MPPAGGAAHRLSVLSPARDPARRDPESAALRTAAAGHPGHHPGPPESPRSLPQGRTARTPITERSFPDGSDSSHDLPETRTERRLLVVSRRAGLITESSTSAIRPQRRIADSVAAPFRLLIWLKAHILSGSVSDTVTSACLLHTSLCIRHCQAYSLGREPGVELNDATTTSLITTRQDARRGTPAVSVRTNGSVATHQG